MTGLLEKALKRAQALPESEQDAIASQILAALDEEESWNRFFEGNRARFEALADEALEEHRHGETRPLDELLDE
jgi:hypothetical protein